MNANIVINMRKSIINNKLKKRFSPLNNILKRSKFNTYPNINQIESKYFDQKVLLYSLISEYIEFIERIETKRDLLLNNRFFVIMREIC
jgi:hypothetical protein